MDWYSFLAFLCFHVDKSRNGLHNFFSPKLIHTENKLQPVERIGRSALSEDKIPEIFLVLSCEDDRDITIPFIERGELHFGLYNSWLYM